MRVFLLRIALLSAPLIAVSAGWLVGTERQFEAARVNGGSMAPALLGRHFSVKCRECKFNFACDADEPPLDERAVCPNCGFANNRLDDEEVRDGDAVLIDLRAYENKLPRRWDVVAIRTPDERPVNSVKRVVGLPGEAVELRGGDVYINGRIASRSLAEQRAMAIVVHDDAFRATPGKAPACRWISATGDTQWKAIGNGYLFDPKSNHGSAEVKWLTYEHRPSYPGDTAMPIRDNYAYSQRISSVHEVSDLMLVCQVLALGRGRLALKVFDGQSWLVAELNAATGVCELMREDETLAHIRLPLSITGRARRIEFSLFDQQVTLAIDGRLIVQRSYERLAAPPSPSSQPLAIGAAGLRIEVERLLVYRDIYYERLRRGPSLKLGENELFLLGDNPRASTDSRTWGGIPRNWLLGRVLRRAE